MEFDVFLSYSSKDKLAADAACHALETAGIRCWMAPRDIVPGAEWGASIVKAIASAEAMVLIFSGNANESRQVTREVERAVNKGIPIIPVRIQDIMPTDSLEYFLSTPHWLDAFRPPLDQYFQQLTKAVATLIGRQPLPQQPVGTPPAVSAPAPARPAPVAARPATSAPGAAPPSGMVVTPRPPSLLPLVTGPELLSKCRDETVLAKLNELLNQRGYHWISIKANEATFGHSAAGDYCSALWVGPTYDMDINYEVRLDNDRLEVEILDCERIL